ncbi:hypothetical protein [Streptomyces sp. NPDC048243]|uniref:hypothetical protein n=1 Tax=Streptomyces sp. NPDC048243 TaxID=3365522 RepID=UPI003715207E
MFHRAAFGLPTASLVILGVFAGPALAEPPAPPSTTTARSELAALTVAAPHSMDGYARDKFDIWASQPEPPPTTRRPPCPAPTDFRQASPHC